MNEGKKNEEGGRERGKEHCVCVCACLHQREREREREEWGRGKQREKERERKKRALIHREQRESARNTEERVSVFVQRTYNV